MIIDKSTQSLPFSEKTFIQTRCKSLFASKSIRSYLFILLKLLQNQLQGKSKGLAQRIWPTPGSSPLPFSKEPTLDVDALFNIRKKKKNSIIGVCTQFWQIILLKFTETTASQKPPHRQPTPQPQLLREKALTNYIISLPLEIIQRKKKKLKQQSH